MAVLPHKLKARLPAGNLCRPSGAHPPHSVYPALTRWANFATRLRRWFFVDRQDTPGIAGLGIDKTRLRRWFFVDRQDVPAAYEDRYKEFVSPLRGSVVLTQPTQASRPGLSARRTRASAPSGARVWEGTQGVSCCRKRRGRLRSTIVFQADSSKSGQCSDRMMFEESELMLHQRARLQ